MPKRVENGNQPPSEGEKNARRGYWRQDDFSARRIYSLLLDKKLTWVGLADSKAGIFDDLVIGVSGEVVAHQVKSSVNPEGVGITALLLGRKLEVKRLAESFSKLRAQFPTDKLRLLYVTDDFAATQDTLVNGQEKTSTKDFLAEKEANRSRSIEEWKNGKWGPLFEKLIAASKLDELAFQDFFSSLEYVMGSSVKNLLPDFEDDLARAHIDDLAKSISKIIIEGGAKDRWSRAELLGALGWPDRQKLRFAHRFPMGHFVQKNEESEPELLQAISKNISGYVSLIGPPGCGKSTLLERALRNRPGVHVLRYLAFVPGTAQGQGRGEADYLYEDMNTQFADVLSGSKRLFETNRTERQHSFEAALLRAGKEYQENGTRFLLVVDGLDHVPREEMPDRSLLAALPLPQAIPDGITIILGTQSMDLPEIPPSVRDQAKEPSRCVLVRPLTFGATRRIADQIGLDPTINRRSIHDVAKGHPLVTRYLIEFIRSSDADAETILSQEFVFDGDLEKVYETAWRGTDSPENSENIKRVLLLIAHSQGKISPELLASGTSDEAVESVLKHAGHLLKIDPVGWDIFHNSFRVFLRAKNVLKFGKPDESFQSPKIYSILTRIADGASSTNPQRWLRFRYLYLSGKTSTALKTATREYFLDQYLQGRAPFDVRGDISDAYRLVGEEPNPTKLFELLLTDDEIARRSEVFEGVDSLIDAYIATDLVENAEDELKLAHPAGKEWLIIDKLLEKGDVSAARSLFEATDLFGSVDSSLDVRPALEWARRAIRFLDNGMLGAALKDHMADIRRGNQSPKEENEFSDIERSLQFCLARATVERTDYNDLTDVANDWGVEADELTCLLIQDAGNSLDEGDQEGAIRSLKTARKNSDTKDLHYSWVRFAAQLALRCQDHVLAKSYIETIRLEPLDNDKYQMLEAVAPACKDFVSNVALFRAVGSPIPEIQQPEQRLLKGAQYHLVEIGCLIGDAMRGSTGIKAEIARVSREAMRYLASARRSHEDDWGASHWMPRIAEEFALALTKLHLLAKCGIDNTASTFDEQLKSDQTIYRWWPGFRRKLIKGIYENDGNKKVALQRLEASFADLRCDDPQEELQEKASFAISFAQIGDLPRARSILLNLRDEALGSYRPAKKDSDYRMWVSILSLANIKEPAHRQDRSAVAIRLVDGLQKTTGYDKASRISRQVLFEAASTDAETSWNAVVWGASSGAFSWFGILDSCLRGLIRRDPKLANIAVLLWSKLALPWFSDGWSSTTETDAFLNELFSIANRNEVEDLEKVLVFSILQAAPPTLKLELLRITEDAATANGGGRVTKAERFRWENDLTIDHDREPEKRDYGHLNTLDQLTSAIEDVEKYNTAKDEKWRADHINFGLRNAATRIIRTSDWDAIAEFIILHVEIAKDWDIALAIAEVAIQFGESAAAKITLEPFIEDQDAGWSWPSSRGRFRYHQIQHILGEVDAHQNALTDFIQHIASTGYGVSTIMWSIDEIFPLIFQDISWDQIWGKLELNIRASRDFKTGGDLSYSAHVDDSKKLIIHLLKWAFSTGATATALQATDAALELLEIDEETVFENLVRLLLSGNGEERMRAMNLLTQAWQNKTLAARFAPELNELSADKDLGISASAIFLATRWGVPITRSEKKIPSFYSLELAIDDRVRGKPVISEHSQALLLDDPFAWTENCLKIIECLADYTGISVLKIRYRVAMLISSWGGIDRFGHAASKVREASLSKINLKLMYRRPHVVVAFRALRNVAGELWQSGLLQYEQGLYILHELHCDPNQIQLPAVGLRGTDLRWPPFPKYSWGDERTQWLNEVAEDLEGRFLGRDIAIGEYRVWVIKDGRDTMYSEQWFGDRVLLKKTDSIERSLLRIGRVVRIGSIIPLDVDVPEGLWPISLFLLNRMDMEPSYLLVFSPIIARQLNWVTREEDPCIYFDIEGNWMARTVCWREGFPQTIDQDGRYAEGQRVVLSTEGVKKYEQCFGQIEITANVWRRIEVPQNKEKNERSYAETR